ncbi:phosphoribosyl-ATP diphosphatase [Parvibium lacunae]|uniref:Phosphoribosyl-ATP pyrophosphatase n=1 Tax=Parvibium lacunae TaxID=1888893 RepID=A0A368L570_9BURK|nr:phosphoribosyl-ATP diphosphatase [Parvibium lacunae]RCS58572.1 phosphoribosyl-ATP diphosphatase [Parvibium lacunae]
MSTILDRVAATIAARHPAHGGDPNQSYVAKLLTKGPDAVLKKIGEEATETVMAAKDANPDQVVYEVADLWFHCLILLAQHDRHPQDVLNELARREGLSGLVEKAQRTENQAD